MPKQKTVRAATAADLVIRQLTNDIKKNGSNSPFMKNAIVEVFTEGDNLVVRAPFSIPFNINVRKHTKGQKWDGVDLVRRFPVDQLNGVLDAINESFPGKVLVLAGKASVIGA